MSLAHEESVGRVHTKIVATIGPATRSADRIEGLIRAGVDVFRLNFSHGTHEDHSATYHQILEKSSAAGLSVAILMDLCGPKIRLGSLPGDEILCQAGETFELVTADHPPELRRLTSNYPGLQGDLLPGQRVLFADGRVEMVAEEANSDRALLRVTRPGPLRSNQGINLPQSRVRLPSLTEKDRLDLDWASQHPVDFIALSFVREAKDIEELRHELTARRIVARVIAKIEKPEAVRNAEAILGVTDAVMVARGDLGVELDVVEVPGVQKSLVASCRAAGIPAIIATEMLASMEHSSRPTRAEASDVFNAVLDGADAVMLSAETAVGEFPIESVRTMSRIVEAAEATGPLARPIAIGAARNTLTPSTQAIVEAASAACRAIEPRLIVVETATGRTAWALSRQRLRTPVLALSADPAVVRSMALLWGITPIAVEDLTDSKAVLRQALRWASTRGIVKEGDVVLDLLGRIPGQRSHQSLRVHTVGPEDLASTP